MIGLSLYQFKILLNALDMSTGYMNNNLIYLENIILLMFYSCAN